MIKTALTAPRLEAGQVGAEAGYWIRNGLIEAFITAQDRIRVLVLRRSGGYNLLSSTGGVTDGLRCWLMTPNDREADRDELASRAGRIEARDGRVHIETTESPSLGLALSWVVSLDPDRAALTVAHRVRNCGTASREVAIWPVIGVEPGARLVLPFSPAGPRHSDARALYHFPWSTLQDTRISTGVDHIQLEISGDATATAHIKLGVFEPAGSGAALIGDTVLVSHTAVERGRAYPEGGPNLTVYASPAHDGRAVGELENVGALHLVEPGRSISLEQVLTVEAAADSRFLHSVGYPGAR